MLLQSNPKFAKWISDVERHTSDTNDEMSTLTTRMRKSSNIMLSSRRSSDVSLDSEGNINCKLASLLDIPVSRINFYESTWKSLIDKTPHGHPQQRNNFIFYFLFFIYFIFYLFYFYILFFLFFFIFYFYFYFFIFIYFLIFIFLFLNQVIFLMLTRSCKKLHLFSTNLFKILRPVPNCWMLKERLCLPTNWISSNQIDSLLPSKLSKTIISFYFLMHSL